MGPRRKYYTLAVLLILAMPSVASAQGALYRYFQAGYYLTKTVDSTLKYELNRTTTGAWLDSNYAKTDTITLGAVRWSPSGSDSGYTTFFDYAGYTQRYGTVHSAYAVANATGWWKLVRIAIRHSYVDSLGNEYIADTVAAGGSSLYYIKPGGTVYVAYSPASSYGTTQDFRSYEPMQMITVWAADPNTSVRITQERCMQQVHLPLILGLSGQLGLDDNDQHITVTLTFERL